MNWLNWLTKLNDWLAQWWPGFKTKTLALIVAVPSVALALLEMFGAIGWDWKLFVGEWAPYAGMAVAAAIYWLRILTARE